MNWSYIAGFFDGEGSITHNNGTGFRITIPQTNEEVLVVMRDFIGFGSIIKLKKRQLHWKDSWLYYISNKKDVYHFLSQAAPHLIVKKRASLQAVIELKAQLSSMRKRKEVHDKRKSEAKLLKFKGWSYRKIGKKLEIDWGYARRLILDLS